MSDEELSLLSREFSAQIILAFKQPLHTENITNKRVSSELVKLSKLKITPKFNELLHKLHDHISAESATLYRLCHRKTGMPLSSMSSSGTFEDDVAICVLSTIMKSQAVLWSALSYRASMLKPKRPLLRLGKTLLTSITVKEVVQFTHRTEQTLHTSSSESFSSSVSTFTSYSYKRQRAREQYKEKKVNTYSERNIVPEKVSEQNTSLAASNNSDNKIKGETSATSTSTLELEQVTKAENIKEDVKLCLDDEQSEFVATHYFARMTSTQEQTRTPALIIMRAVHNKLESVHLAISNSTDKKYHNVSFADARKNNNNNKDLSTSRNDNGSKKGSDNFYTEINELDELSGHDELCDNSATSLLPESQPFIPHTLKSELESNLFSGSGNNNWLRLVSELREYKQFSKYRTLSCLISNPELLFSMYAWGNKIEIEQRNELVKKKCKLNSSDDNTLLSIENFNTYITSKLLWTRLLVCSLWVVMLEVLENTEEVFVIEEEYREITYRLCINVIRQAHEWSAETRCPVCDELQLETPPIHWSFIKEDRNEFNRQLLHFTNTEEAFVPWCAAIQPILELHKEEEQEKEIEVEEEEKEEKEQSHEELKQNVGQQYVEKQYYQESSLERPAKIIHGERINSNNTINNNSNKSIVAPLTKVQQINFLWHKCCQCSTLYELLTILRKSSNTTQHLKEKQQQQQQQEEQEESESEFEEEQNNSSLISYLSTTERQEHAASEGTRSSVDTNNATSHITSASATTNMHNFNVTSKMRYIFVCILTERLFALVEVLEVVTRLRHRKQFHHFTIHPILPIHTNYTTSNVETTLRKHQHEGESEEDYCREKQNFLTECNKKSNSNNNNKSSTSVYNNHFSLGDEKMEAVLHRHSWVLGEHAECIIQEWVNASPPSLHSLVTKWWLSNMNYEWCAAILCQIPFNGKEVKNTSVNNRNVSLCGNSLNMNKKKTLQFSPYLPFLLKKDKIVECAKCYAWFHHRCIAPPQDCFSDGVFLCHSCRLMMYKELLKEINWHKDQQEFVHEQWQIENSVIQCIAYEDKLHFES